MSRETIVQLNIMNSIIEAQITLQEEQAKEYQRCLREPLYFFYNYLTINGCKFYPREIYEIALNQYLLTPNECIRKEEDG